MENDTNYSVGLAIEILEQFCIATTAEISLVTAINGYNIESLEDILYVRTGYHSFEQFMEEF